MHLHIAGVVLLGWSQWTMADLFEPFSTSNLNPFAQAYGLPLAKSAKIAEPHQWQIGLQTDFANNFTDSAEVGESISIDGETYRATLSLRYGLNANWEAGIDLPYLNHRGGTLDSFIEDWHQLFGLPNGGREDRATDQLLYQYQRGAQTTRITDSVSGIGDIRLHLAYQIQNEPGRQLAVRAGVKLPSGDADELLGSDSTDLFASLHISDDNLIKHPNWKVHGHLGVLVPGDGDVLESSVEDAIFYGSGTIAWQLRERLSLKVQVDMHSAFFDSELRELGDPSAQLLLGGSVRLGEKTYLDISVSEDIVTDTSPDVVFQFGLRTTIH